MVKRAAVDDVGPWDEGYFLHVEDLDYCTRSSARLARRLRSRCHGLARQRRRIPRERGCHRMAQAPRHDAILNKHIAAGHSALAAWG